MSSSIGGSFNPIDPTQGQYVLPESMKGNEKQITEQTEKSSQIANPQNPADNPEKVQGHGGRHSKTQELEDGHRSYRSQLRHMKNPVDSVRQQKMLMDLEMQERMKRAESRKKGMVVTTEQLDKKNISKRDDKKDTKNKSHDSNDEESKDQQPEKYKFGMQAVDDQEPKDDETAEPGSDLLPS